VTRERFLREGFLREAVRLATDSVEEGGGPFGAVVVRASQVVGRGRNRVTESCDPTAHAEVVAIRDACANLGSHQLEGCEIYCSSEPCPMCLGAIYWARPDVVFFASARDEAAAAGFDDAFIYNEIERLPGDRRIGMRRIDVEGAEEPFRLWEAKGDRVEY
jgi:tRNA(Arg) A34 adenosine deaminase TadA